MNEHGHHLFILTSPRLKKYKLNLNNKLTYNYNYIFNRD